MEERRRLKEWMEAERLSLTEVAKRTGYSVSYVCDISKKRKNGSVAFWTKVKKAFGLTIDETIDLITDENLLEILSKPKRRTKNGK